MKLASLREGGRDGTLIVVDKSLGHAVRATDVVPTLQGALDNWEAVSGPLSQIGKQLEAGDAPGSFSLDVSKLAAPLPRAYQFVDGSAYLAHVERVRKARGAEMPPSFLTDPLMYQAVSDGFLGPRDPVEVESEEFGIDFESEVCVITGDVPMGVSPGEAGQYVRLVVLINDVSLRNLIPAELGKGFGFLNSKPRSALSPVAVTPEELGDAWRDSKVHLPLVTHYNGSLFGEPECALDMQFDFGQLIAHAAKTRPLGAGTIVGSGTIANQDESRGASCLAEKRVIEVVRDGKASTPFMSFGDRVRIEMLDKDGDSIFGAIDQTIEQYDGARK
ncbi:MAG: fumarylacetoacetate hydrolase family protein [Gammaproteobacteria bacterium]|nr:fumarylacetoacetate hydrolase family protein [Gammaproteobacteria bacterium]